MHLGVGRAVSVVRPPLRDADAHPDADPSFGYLEGPLRQMLRGAVRDLCRLPRPAYVLQQDAELVAEAATVSEGRE